MSDRLTAARDALLALHDFLWDEMEWFSDESAPMPRYTTMAHGQKHDDLVERFHDAYPELLAAAEAPGRVAALEAFIERVATMGFCSQTHHEHIVRDANRLLAAPAPTPSEPVARCAGHHDFLPMRCSRCGARGNVHLSIVGEDERMDTVKTTPGARDE